MPGASELNVRKAAGTGNDSIAKLKKGDQVPVTKLEIVKDSGTRTLTVWGRVETSDGIVGYCDLSYMSEGALYEKKEEPTTPTTPSAPTIGSTGNTGDGGFVNNKGGYKHTGQVINPNSLFDVQVKRLHEYKRQHLNALHILSLYNEIKSNPHTDIQPTTFIFGAKAAPGYYMAKQIIKFICSLGKMIENDPQTRDILKVVYLEDYRVTLSELLMPASEVSEQISLAGTEASGTGNMKLMLNGAVTLGTWDGANVEIGQSVGEDNIFVFGMRTPEVQQLKKSGYYPSELYLSDPVLKQAIDMIGKDIAGDRFDQIATSLKTNDPYMVLRDFESYDQTKKRLLSTYQHDPMKWQKMSLNNIAQSGYFCADRAIQEYAHNIWNLD